ncbi:MAG: DUF58 domain-containing protein [Eubacteriales bacterium]|nr:DUF58 domain-containing protein [Eubacteriales bacterium]
MNRRFIYYLLLCVVGYSIFSYLDQNFLRFIFLFLLFLPISSFLHLFVARYFVRWLIRVEDEHPLRMEENRAVVSILNLSFFFFPRIDIYIDEPDESQGFIITGKARGEMQTPEQLRNQGGRIDFERLPGELGRSELLQLSNSDYAKTLEKNVSTALRVPFRRFFLFPKLLRMRATRRVSVYLAAYSRYDWHFRYTPIHVGNYRIDATRVYAHDLLGFFSLPLHASKNVRNLSFSQVFVRPNQRYYNARFLHKLPEPQPSDLARMNNSISSEINSIANIRSWRPGDRMKDIHFNISAKLQDFYVREYEDPRRGGILFILDPYAPLEIKNLPAYYDELSETCASIIYELNRGDGPIVLHFGDKSIEGPGQSQGLDYFLEFLTLQKLKPSQERRLAEELERQKRISGLSRLRRNRLESDTEREVLPSLSKMLNSAFRSENYRGIIVISPSFTPLLAETMLNLARQRGTRIVFCYLESHAGALESRAAKERIQDEKLSLEVEVNKTSEEQMSVEEREQYFRRLEEMKVIVFHVSLDSLDSRIQSDEDLPFSPRSKRKISKRNSGKRSSKSPNKKRKGGRA